MKRINVDRRKLVVAGTAILLAGCQIIPKTTETRPHPTDTSAAAPAPMPSATALPTDQKRHRVALLVPMSGTNSQVGKAIANATTMALLDTNADNLRITTYDTATSPTNAAAKAIADGNKLVLGPLLSDNVPLVRATVRPANVPLIAFSNDASVASSDVFVMGHVPEQSIARTVAYARGRGGENFAVVVPEGEYGRRAEAAMSGAILESGGRLVGAERYARGNSSIVSAAQRMQQRGGFDTVLVADGARLSALAAGIFRPSGSGTTQILGTELWSGEGSVTKIAALRGSWFSAVSDARFKRFSDSYKARFGGQPYRIATLGYDAVLLALRVAQDWKPGTNFPTKKLRDKGGFLGLDGAFRFQRSGVVQRAMEVREVRDGKVVIVSPAPTKFED